MLATVRFDRREHHTTQQHRNKRHGRPRELKCGVCGLAAKGSHFGGIACDSCKSFFRNAIRNDTYRHFTCQYDGRCPILPPVKKACPSCRFTKCLRNDMNPSWVMTVQERQKLRESLLNKQASLEKIHRIYDPDPKELWEKLTEEEISTVRRVVLHYKDVAKKVLFRDIVQDVCHEVQPTSAVVATLTALDMTYMFRLIQFASGIPEFARLQRENRHVLIRESLMEIAFLRMSFEYDTRTKSWPNDNSHERYPQVKHRLYEDWMSSACLQKCITYSEALMKLQMDEACILLLAIIALLTTDNRPGLTERGKIEALQEHFLSILRKYVEWRYGTQNATVVYPKLLAILTEVHEMAALCKEEKHYWIDESGLGYVERKLGRWNPWREYSLAKRNELFLPASVDPYDVLDDAVPTVEMLHRSAHCFFQDVCEEEQRRQEQHPCFVDSADVLSVIKDLEIDQTSLTNSEFDQTAVFFDNSSSSSWLPEDFDLSWC